MSRPDFIETHTGRRVRPLVPDAYVVNLTDIAHSLSQQCRFSGHTRIPYSVAEHSVRVAELLAEWGCSREVQLWGLLHDASEAYLQDVAAPVKHTDAFEAYRVAEAGWMRVICERFHMPSEEPDDVRRADAVMLATEARDLMPYRAEHWGGLLERPLPAIIQPWSPAKAKAEFTQLFMELSK